MSSYVMTQYVCPIEEHIAGSQSTSVDQLERLTWHPKSSVRLAVAENKNTPLKCIWALASDVDPDVRYQLAENHQLPLSVLNMLTADENPYVACRARATISRVQGEVAINNSIRFK